MPTLAYNVHTVEDCPDGYPLLAAFLDSDDNFMVYRRFGYLQARLLLEKQQQLSRLEQSLQDLDEQDLHENLITMENIDTEERKVRRELMESIDERFREYGTNRKFSYELYTHQSNKVPASFSFTTRPSHDPVKSAVLERVL